MDLNNIQQYLLKEIADIDGNNLTGAYNIRSDSMSIGRQSTKNIEIVSKTGVSGMDIFIKPDTVGESVHIPVVMTRSGLKEEVYNDFSRAAASTTAALMTPSTTVSTASMSARTPRSNMSRSTSAQARAQASVSSTPSPRSIWKRAAPARWKWCRSRA